MASIFEAAGEGNIATMNEFMDADDFDIDAKDAAGNTALHCAALNGEAAAGSLLVECSASVDVTDAHGNTPLILAGIHDKRLSASMLLWAGAERDLQNEKGNTALHEAAISGAKDVAWLIVENGGERSVIIKNKDGKTPLELARQGTNEELVELLEGTDREVNGRASAKESKEQAEQAVQQAEAAEQPRYDADNAMMTPD
eukprot:TRINITY_DN115493_c0_g1_i1.p1 TRINITY_DN115493_c0_g1~~TRINITY_DN115493_c0_g1_i1.p1  ORF type:complete len:213 (-),score=62.86 TRINITY_DN115493_c0_g1_i1:77-676(-)